MPSIGRQLYLRTCVPATDKNVEHGQTKVARELAGLIETTRSFSSSMKRNRDHAIGVFKHLSAAPSHHRRETGCERTAPVVFERMDHLPQGTLVLAYGSSSLNDSIGFAAFGAGPGFVIRDW